MVTLLENLECEVGEGPSKTLRRRAHDALVGPPTDRVEDWAIEGTEPFDVERAPLECSHEGLQAGRAGGHPWRSRPLRLRVKLRPWLELDADELGHHLFRRQRHDPLELRPELTLVFREALVAGPGRLVEGETHQPLGVGGAERDRTGAAPRIPYQVESFEARLVGKPPDPFDLGLQPPP